MKPSQNSPEAMCQGKKGFHSWSSANSTLKRRETARRLSGRDIEPLKLYRCQVCGKWHVGGVA